jgi:hypothetical protein
VVASCSAKVSVITVEMRLRGPHSRSGCFGKEWIIVSQPVIELGFTRCPCCSLVVVLAEMSSSKINFRALLHKYRLNTAKLFWHIVIGSFVDNKNWPKCCSVLVLVRSDMNYSYLTHFVVHRGVWMLLEWK